jgi:spore coat polysaccharide biosynthesis protein SpsF
MNSQSKIGALIPVRLASERLPGKALRLVNGRPVIAYLLDRVAQCRYLERKDIVVCTTTDPSDDLLEEVARGEGVSVFRGDNDDLIKRFRDAMVAHGFSAVVQVDGDDPLTDPQYMSLTMEALLADGQLGIVWSEGLPLGVNCKSFTRNAMDMVYSAYVAGQNDTGFIYYFTKTDILKKKIVRPVDSRHVLDGVRLTLDYEEDLAVIGEILTRLDRPGAPAPLAEVVAFLKENPQIAEKSQGLDEQYWQRTRDKAVLSYRDEGGAVHRIQV